MIWLQRQSVEQLKRLELCANAAVANDEIRMTDDERMRNDQMTKFPLGRFNLSTLRLLDISHSSFGVHSSFVIRHSSLPL